ncbi:hypothetical protein A2662_03895 [Candidatus Giovannonibacteria bacterium RIFCSPHIGHO2_01_FULL_45_33]|uniref:Uncharacterized protein n=1 Tax=Candidatus Giovannonibacteria bacterium RIFCSPLOWO2_01_FULL_45_34 TaxID=1798351 RepID=A0A1F5X059_9BACT|nr:MAG: hypothetical protein A2662_03895 [Candidatus Giovannonibacteria bacterium RIFCSPHIGHO2_01_FULL_45_33]OGF69341.1 MAG: hypothetical protein A3C73_01880 [Candidatus Giovannonibacteria bacterium RIFCSPHIGHO2_02_FULL_44_11]OGF81243.1 MAG: hypothetical protein A2930_02160 [Candidatus Giovannonibacteria bacterium RIFCSPLOWO2_01_FULL_45_34]
MTIQKIYIGGWFQRTTLHLSEIYDFLKEGKSELTLDPAKLNDLRGALGIDSVEMKIDSLDYILFLSKSEIEIKIYEDGLIVLSKKPEGGAEANINGLTDYYETKLSPAISYIFSLGAPVPKELANIKTIYPYFLVLDKASKSEAEALLKDFSQEKYFEITKQEFEVYRGNKLYIINNRKEDAKNIEDFIHEQIFMREFKGQLHRYLNLHRIIWERIAEVKEKGKINGGEIGSFKDKIEGYAKTINLIEARINQMGAYIRTRASIAKSSGELKKFADILEFKYETLVDTLEYIKHIWGMTKNYVNSALDLFSGLQAKSTESSVKNLTVITSMGVGATLINLFTQQPPKLNFAGAVYFAVLAVIGYATNLIMQKIAMKRMYNIKNIKLAKDIK